MSKTESTAKMDENGQSCIHEQLDTDTEPDTDQGMTQCSQESTLEEEPDTRSQLTSQEMRILVAELAPTDEEQSKLVNADQHRLMRLTHEEKTITDSPLSSQDMQILLAELSPSQ